MCVCTHIPHLSINMFFRNNFINAARSSRDQENIFARLHLEFSNVTILKVAVARQSSFVLKETGLVWI